MKTEFSHRKSHKNAPKLKGKFSRVRNSLKRLIIPRETTSYRISKLSDDAASLQKTFNLFFPPLLFFRPQHKTNKLKSATESSFNQKPSLCGEGKGGTGKFQNSRFFLDCAQRGRMHQTIIIKKAKHTTFSFSEKYGVLKLISGFEKVLGDGKLSLFCF